MAAHTVASVRSISPLLFSIPITDLEPLELKYCVFMVSLKKSHVENKRRRYPNFENLRILVKQSKELQAALNCSGREQFNVLGLKYPNRFKRLRLDEGLYGFDSTAEAYRHAYGWRDSLLEKKRKVKVHGDSGSSNCSVYCMKLKQEVWQNAKFVRHNPGLAEHAPIAFYVGQTCAPILQRLQQHVNPESDKSSNWGRDYFDYDSDQPNGLEAAMELSLAWVQKWNEATIRPISGLTTGESLVAEADLAVWLQSQGYGAYFA